MDINRKTFLGRSLAAYASLDSLSSLGVASRPDKDKLRVGIIGCGRMGQYYAEVYQALPDTEIVAIAEWNSERRKIVGERFRVKAMYKDVNSMLRDTIPDITAVITPTKYMKEAVIACAEAGVKGVTTDKPIAAKLSDADEMVNACEKRGVVFGGGNLQRAMPEVQEAAQRLKAGKYGRPTGMAVHGFGGEISGGGCQHVSVLRLFSGAEVEEVMAWAGPPEALEKKDDAGLNVNALFQMSRGPNCRVFGLAETSGERPLNGVDVWSEDALIRWKWGKPEIYEKTNSSGARQQIDPKYSPFSGRNIIDQIPGLRQSDDYLVASIRSFIDSVKTRSGLWISGHDLRQALEVAIACKVSARLGNLPVKLPLEDRSLTLYPRPYRWLGGDATENPQSGQNASGEKV